MDDITGYVYLTTRVEREISAMAKVLTHAKIPYAIKTLPKSVGPAFGAIGLVRQEVLVPEADLMRARAIIGEGDASAARHHWLPPTLAAIASVTALLGFLYWYIQNH